MYAQQQPTRNIPGIISYLDYFSTKKSAYIIFFSLPIIIGLLSFILNSIYTSIWNLFYLSNALMTFYITMGTGIVLSIFYYSKRAPSWASPPKGWGIQMNAFTTGMIGLSLIIGQIITIFLRNVTFQEVFFILGTILAYIISFVLH